MPVAAAMAESAFSHNGGIIKVAVVEKGWLRGGSAGRNAAVIRSSYLRGKR